MRFKSVDVNEPLRMRSSSSFTILCIRIGCLCFGSNTIK